MQITEHEEQTYIASYTGNVMFAVLFFNICCYKLRLSWQNKLRRKLIKIIFSFTLIITLYPHGMRPVRFLSASVWFRDVMSFSDVSGVVCVRVAPASVLMHQTYCSDSRLLERRPYQTHQKRTWRHEIRRMRQKNRTGRIPCASRFAKQARIFILLTFNFFSSQGTLYNMSQKCSTRSEKLLQDWLLMMSYPTSTDKEKTSCWLKN